MLSPLNLVCSLGPGSWVSSVSLVASAADRVGSKQIHKSAEKVLDWRRYQPWGSWVSLVGYSRVESA